MFYCEHFFETYFIETWKATYIDIGDKFKRLMTGLTVFVNNILISYF